jgi:hypothetical protein
MSLRLGLKTLFRITTIAVGALLVVAAEPPAKSAEVKGVLLDTESAPNAELRLLPDGHMEGGMLWAYTYTREFALKPQSQKNGYGVFTYDQGFLAFDSAGNAKALQLLRSSKKVDDLRVLVAGEIKDKTIKVQSIKFLDNE